MWVQDAPHTITEASDWPVLNVKNLHNRKKKKIRISKNVLKKK